MIKRNVALFLVVVFLCSFLTACTNTDMHRVSCGDGSFVLVGLDSLEPYEFKESSVDGHFGFVSKLFLQATSDFSVKNSVGFSHDFIDGVFCKYSDYHHMCVSIMYGEDYAVSSESFDCKNFRDCYLYRQNGSDLLFFIGFSDEINKAVLFSTSLPEDEFRRVVPMIQFQKTVD